MTARNKVEYIDRIEAVRLGISYDLLIDAVSEGGGAIDIDGHHPVTHETYVQEIRF
ncbi:MAG: hypothetical protein MUO26_11005 [Methanotrichaceae archaeon]|nr:hypothetical protein [Methanotrichaceae archaeon]